MYCQRMQNRWAIAPGCCALSVVASSDLAVAYQVRPKWLEWSEEQWVEVDVQMARLTEHEVVEAYGGGAPDSDLSDAAGQAMETVEDIN